jgi:hypothetical protein
MAFIVDGKWVRVQGRPQAMSLTKTRAMQSVAVKFLPRSILLNTLESTSFNGF